MLELLRNLNNTFNTIFDKMAVDSRIGECLSRGGELEESLQTSKTIKGVVSTEKTSQVKESGQKVV